MSDTVALLIWFVGAPLLLIIMAALAVCADWTIYQIETFATAYQMKIAGWRMNVTEKSYQMKDREAFLRWLEMKSGTGRFGPSVDEELINAQRQADLIRILIDDEVPKAVLRCVDTHRLTAKIVGAYKMLEIAYEPECYRLRAGTLWLLAHTVQLLEDYPLRLDDERLLHNSIVLRKRAVPTCSKCPYIQLVVDQAPRLCPTAELVQLRGSNHEAGH
jgi:hypothetical protein